jgi:hypothetical protein
MSDGEFSVYQFFKDGQYERVADHVDVPTAMNKFAHFINSVGAKLGVVVRVIVTDGGDHTAVEWINGQGVTFPPELKNKDFSRRKNE